MSELSFVQTPAAAAHSLLRDAPRVSRTTAALSRRLGRGLHLSGNERRPALQLLPQAGARGAGRWLALHCQPGTVWLEEGARVLAALTGVHGSDPEDTSDAADAAVLVWPAWLVGTLAGRLQGTLLASLNEIRSASPEDLASAALVTLQLRLLDDGHAISVRAAARPEIWLALLEANPETIEPLRMQASAWSGAEFPCRVPLARHRLPPAQFDALAEGDVILPDFAYFDIAGCGRLSLAGCCWRVRYSGARTLELLNQESYVEHQQMEDESRDGLADESGYDEAGRDDRVDSDDREEGDGGEEKQQPPGHSALPGMPSLTLRFELGRLNLNLDRLRSLGPGSVLELSEGAAGDIAIACGGALVGRGEVVDVEGRLGIRITRWSGAC